MPWPHWKRVIVLTFGLFLSSLPEGRVFGIDVPFIISMFANLVNVGVLAFFLAILLYRPVRDVLRKRTNRIQGQLANAEEEMAKATELRLLYEQKMEDVEQEREKILNEARKLGAENSRQLIAEAKVEADALRERATANVEMEWERARTEMRTTIIEVSSVLAEKFVSIAMNKEAHDQLFDETMADLEGLTWRD
jgi:F-type H+-transporting ATPase subunit b